MLLDYALQTAPSPLQAGSSATLTFVISNSGSEMVTVTSIVISLPIGMLAKDLTASPGDWQVQTPPGWSLAQNGGVLTLVPTSDGKVGPTAIVVTITGLLVNNQPGTAHIAIRETAARGSGAPTAGTMSLAVAKFPT
jgi:hypothetical protein